MSRYPYRVTTLSVLLLNLVLFTPVSYTFEGYISPPSQHIHAWVHCEVTRIWNLTFTQGTPSWGESKAFWDFTFSRYSEGPNVYAPGMIPQRNYTNINRRLDMSFDGNSTFALTLVNTNNNSALRRYSTNVPPGETQNLGFYYDEPSGFTTSVVCNITKND